MITVFATSPDGRRVGRVVATTGEAARVKSEALRDGFTFVRIVETPDPNRGAKSSRRGHCLTRKRAQSPRSAQA